MEMIITDGLAWKVQVSTQAHWTKIRKSLRAPTPQVLRKPRLAWFPTSRGAAALARLRLFLSDSYCPNLGLAGSVLDLALLSFLCHTCDV